MTRYRTALIALATATALVAGTGGAIAKNYTISVWSGGSGPNDNYRTDAIKIAADQLMRQEAILGNDMKITVKTKPFSQWDAFKQAVTLAAEAGTAPNIVVTGHEDIAPWAQSGLIVPIEDYIDIDSWPINGIYKNLLAIGAFNGQQWGVPQDAESRPMFFWKDHLRGIGYSDADIAALPAKIQSGKYTLQNVLIDAKKMQDAGLVAPGYGFYPRVSNGPDYWQFYTSFGGKLENDNGKLVFDKAAMAKFYQFFVDAVASGVTRKNHIGTPWDQWYSEVASGKAGIWDGGTWHYARYTKKEGLKDFFGKIQFGLIPAGDANGKPNTLTHPLVYLLTKQPSEDVMTIAAKLVALASAPEINALHAIKSAHLGISKAETEISFYANDRWTREASKRLLPYASAMPNNVNFGQYWEIMWSGLQSAWTGQKTVAQAIADDETKLKATLGDNIIIR